MEGKDDDNSTTEIEVTPEMIEAGADILAGYDSRFDLEDEFLRVLYLAMTKAARIRKVG
jgi:hypothetical protein